MDPEEGGLTALEGAILGVVTVLLAMLAVHALSVPAGPPAGIVYSALGETGGCLVVSGDVYGYALANGSVGGTDLWCARPDRSRMGSVACSVRLFIGNMGSVDMSRTTVAVTTPDETEHLGRTAEAPIQPGNWTIVRMVHTIPLQQADDDFLLEPGEQFDLLVYPARSLAPGESFRISIIPPGGVPLTVERTVPPRITPVMDLG
ncbi:MAG: flagellin [Methanoculleus sp.]|nr:flagellin [Methanoculleus sp.]